MKQNFQFKPAEIGKFTSTGAADAARMLCKNCRIYGFTMGDFSLIDLIYHILVKIDGGHVITATWSAGIKDAHQVKWMMDSNLIYSYQIITDRSYETRQAKYALTLEQLFGRDNIRTSNIHAKFTLIQNDNWKICIRTSMNLNANKTCENFEIEEGDSIYDFHADFCRRLFKTMPIGFCGDKAICNESLKKFFYGEQKNDKQRKWFDVE